MNRALDRLLEAQNGDVSAVEIVLSIHLEYLARQRRGIGPSEWQLLYDNMMNVQHIEELLIELRNMK